jgi:hypothetical protein
VNVEESSIIRRFDTRHKNFCHGSTRCEIRKTIFSWTRTRFPLHIRSTRELTINETPIITVIGKAFWDVGHASKDQSNRRKRLSHHAVWEIHLVMALHVVQ